ncbi:MAG: alpha/beta hydrolase [Caulobacteraceae bacterium]
MHSNTLERAASKATYDPGAQFELEASEVEYRRTAQGRSLMARIYRPLGAGSFPVVLGLHGGGWNFKDRRAEEPFDRAIASAGALVVAVDLTLAPEAPYPACVQDANYAVRWLKAKAGAWNGDASRIGVFGSSTGGHVAELLAMRPCDPRYSALPFEEDPALDATVDYVITRSPISDTFARFENAQAMQSAMMVKFNERFFVPWETIHEANPREILERREAIALKPLLIMQGALDDNVRPAPQTRFVEAYRAAGGSCDYTIFEDCGHEWVATPGPQTDRAYELAKDFIARQVNA